MTAADLDLVLDWAAAEGWNPGLADRDAFLAADPGGFLMGFLDDAPVAAISVVNYGSKFGFLGLYICRPEFRGRGHGWALWQAGMARFGDRVVGLDGVEAQQANYARSGFVLARRNARYSGIAQSHAMPDPHIVELGTSQPELADAITEYDRAIFPAPRDAFIGAWLKPPGRRTLGYLRQGTVAGYASARACRSGHKIGPLFADSAEIAERLFVALTTPLAGERISLDVPEPNAEAVALAERHGLTPTFATARMYRGPAPAEPLGRIFGITTLELG